MNPLRAAVIRELLRCGGWVQREALDGLTSSVVALDDVLADLVVDGEAEHRRHIGYRLTGSALVRHACQRLEQDPTLQRAVVGYERATEEGVQTVLGMAQRHPDLPGGMVGYELALPVVGSQSEGLTQAMRVLSSFSRNLK